MHVPKTAGTSFLNTLKLVYGQMHVAEDYYGSLPKRSVYAKIIHGHFPASKYDYIFSKAKKITWLRDPTERIISWYYYWLQNKNNNDSRYLKFISEKPNLVEFSEWKEVRTELSEFYFKNCELESFSIIGFTEDYKESLAKMSQLFDWKNCKLLQNNHNPNKSEINKITRDKIKSNLAEEYMIYNAALKLFK